MKEKYDPPDVYRLTCRFGRWVSKSQRFFPASSVDEVLNDFYLVFNTSRAVAKSVKIHKIERYNRFSDKWEDQMNMIQQYPEIDPDTMEMHVYNNGRVRFRKK